MKLLNLGCGNCFHKDWINIDFVSNNEHVAQYNLLKGIPFKDNSIDVVYHSHVLEHFSRKDGENFIKECHRVLNKGGIIRVAVPDLESIAKEYLSNLELANKGDVDAANNYNWIKLELLDQMVRNKSGGEMAKYLNQSNVANEHYVFERIGLEGKNLRNAYFKRQQEGISLDNGKPYKASIKKNIRKYIKNLIRYTLIALKLREPMPNPEILQIGSFRLSGEIHQWMYDSYSLKKLFIETGFLEVRICSAFQSQIENWEQYELDVVAGEVRKPDSLFIEGKKL